MKFLLLVIVAIFFTGCSFDNSQEDKRAKIEEIELSHIDNKIKALNYRKRIYCNEHGASYYIIFNSTNTSFTLTPVFDKDSKIVPCGKN